MPATALKIRTLASALFFLLAAAPAGAAATSAGLYVSGRGSGHGIGMSQYGAAGYALHGQSYEQILGDYYAQTTVGHVSPSQPVTVLLRGGGPAVFSGADRIAGSRRRLDPATSYSVHAGGGRLQLVSVGGQPAGSYRAPLEVRGPGPLTLAGLGAYRGALVFRPGRRGGVMTVNAVGLDNYVRGVMAAEMPPSWPQQALEAQAVVARTYAITSRPAGAHFEVFDTTRSQVYEGVRAETPQTDAAVAATSGQVVEYDGNPVVTYFFASSGGETESVQNVFQVAPEPWLVGRMDPYDDSLGNPYYHWKLHFALSAARARLGRLVHGSLVGIRVIRRGVSPRVVTAEVVGTRGVALVSGAQLRQDLGTPSAWMSLTTVSVHGVRRSIAPPPDSTGTTTTPTPTPTTPTPTPTLTTTTPTTTTSPTTTAAQPPPTSGGGGIASQYRHTGRRRLQYLVSGTVFPGVPGAVVRVELAVAGAWRPVARGRISAGGRYAVAVAGPGRYRIMCLGIAGPQVTVA